uniref:Uncharacterized protein n=1 Tax=Lepeophtheirus salmonis TaxID=72036 RepID=A0A0K2UZC4_LEPSM
MRMKLCGRLIIGVMYVSNNLISVPYYFPTIFPTSHVNPRTFSDKERQGRFLKRCERKKKLEVLISKVDSSVRVFDTVTNIMSI